MRPPLPWNISGCVPATTSCNVAIASNESWFWNNKQTIAGWVVVHLPKATENGKQWTAIQVKPSFIPIKTMNPSLKIA